MKFGRFNTVSNYISILRLLLGIPFWFILQTNSSDPNYVAAALALFAAFTDMMDGFLARKLNQVTEWGKVIDPLADKVCMAVVVIQLWLHGSLPSLLFWVIISRDALILIASAALSTRLQKVLPSNYLGKITVLIIGLYLIFLMLNLQFTHPQINDIFYKGAVLMIFVSVAGYGMRAKEFLQGITK